MIIFPAEWNNVGKRISLKTIEAVILETIKTLKCSCLSLSGGIDSSLLLFYMTKIFKRKDIQCFTLVSDKSHPDYIFSKKMIDFFNVKWRVYIASQREIEKAKTVGKFEGDGNVKLFYNFVSRYTNKIITGDGADEIMCGYYEHQKFPDEKTYYNFMEQLQEKQLIPLDTNSGNVRVLLPYLVGDLIVLLSQIPLSSKVDRTNRKKIMIELSKDKLPIDIIERRKYGFCDALKRIKQC